MTSGAADNGNMYAIAAGNRFGSAGGVDAVFTSAKHVWKKTCGECPAMESPGSVRTAAGRTGSATSDHPE